MDKIVNYLKVDFYKFYHSNIIKIHLIIPIITIASFLAYYQISPWSELDKVIAYIQIISMFFPFIISIIVNMVYEQEQEAGFQFLLGTISKRSTVHFSKLISILILGLISTMLAIIGFGCIFKLMGNNLLDMEFYFKVAFVILGSSIIVYMIQYLVVFVFGKGASIGLGIVGTLISALMLTGIGDGMWHIVPWAYSIRLCLYTTSYNIDTIMQNKEITMAIIMMILYIVISLVLILIFSNKWEGRKENY